MIVCGFYLMALFSDVLAPYDYRTQSRREPLMPPSPLHFRDVQGRWCLRPFIYARQLVDALARRYEENTERAYPISFFTRGDSYRFLGIFETNLHLFGIEGESNKDVPRIYLLGADELGRDRFSRLLAATHFSLLVGPLGSALASVLGVLIGLAAGFSGRWIDAILMRAADVMMALPTLALILAARATFPLELPPARAATLLISLFIALGWAEMARLARGLTLELRQREFSLAAVSLGCSPVRLLFRHILPNAAPALLTQAFLLLPAFLLAETSLSFLGVGLQEPEASWGSLLTAVADINLLERKDAWAMLTPAFAMTLFALGVRLLGDGFTNLRRTAAPGQKLR